MPPHHFLVCLRGRHAAASPGWPAMAFIEERGPYMQLVNGFLARVDARSGPG